MTKAEPKPKLPDVWVVIDVVSSPYLTAAFNSREAAIRQAHAYGPATVYRYTLAKPAKVCVYKWNATTEYWETGCEMATSRPPQKFCPYCGGKIVTKGAKR